MSDFFAVVLFRTTKHFLPQILKEKGSDIQSRKWQVLVARVNLGCSQLKLP